MATPHKELFGKDADLLRPRTIGARAFVHIDTYTNNLDNKA